MKRSDLFIRLMTGVIFLAVASYAGIVLYNAVAKPYETTVAVSYTAEETFSAGGYVVRTEIVLSDFGDAVLPIVSEGERVGAGQSIAVEYLDRQSLERASEIRALTIKIAQIEAAYGVDDAAGRIAIIELSSAVHRKNFRRLDEIAASIEASIFVEETDVDILRSRLEELHDRNIGARVFAAPVSGTFSQAVDGFEHINPNVIRDMLPSDLHAHFRTPLRVPAAGKLITEFRWYYVAVMQYSDALHLHTGQSKLVQFFGAYQSGVDMVIENIGRREGDSCVVLFSSTRGIHEIASVRALRADVVNSTITGIRVPKEAIHLENRDGEVIEYIFLQTSGYAERVDIERLPVGNPIEIGDSYLVRDGTETGSPLREGSIIIVRASDLYHGKVLG